MIHTLKMFNTGQVTLPKKWRSQFKTKNFTAEETQHGLLIKPLRTDGEDDIVYYEDDNGYGLHFPGGIDPKELLSRIKLASDGH